MAASISELEHVYQMLEDEESQFTYLNRLNYLISGDCSFIDKIVEQYLSELPLWGRMTSEQFLSKLPADRQIVLFGAGISGRGVLPIFQNDKRFLGFCSSTEEKQKNGFLGWPVIGPEELLSRRDLTVVISSADAKQEIQQILQAGGYPQEQVFTLDGLTTSYNDQYFGPSFLRYEPEEVFVDAGCCNLRSALALRAHCGRVKKVYAFEPEPENYKVCLRNRERYKFPEVKLFPFGVWSERTTLHFSAGNAAVSCISEEGTSSVPVMPIDEAVDTNNRVTFIKMDIEGSELEALKGAQQTIQRDRPKLAICIYHKPEDMTDIPLYIKSLVPEYRLYVRHHSNRCSETVLYAVMP